MEKANPSVIVLKHDGEYIYKDFVTAVAPILPGRFIKRNGTAVGTTFEVIAEDTAGVAGPLLIAVVNSSNGSSIDTPYPVGDALRAFYPKRGDEVLALVEDGTAAISIGDPLQLDALGGVVPLAAGVQIGTALTAVDNSAGSGPVALQIEIV